MKKFLDFLINAGKLKGKKRRGWVVHQIKNSESTAEHIFRTSLIAWILGSKKKLNLERVIKIALIHDLCEVYAPDLTPYDPLLPKDPKRALEVLKKWPKFTTAIKIKKQEDKYKAELNGLDKLTSQLPQNLKAEIKNLWLDFEKGLTREGRFVKQVDKVENLLQGIEYWKKYGKIQHKLWMRWIKEIIDDPVLIEFVRTIENNFCKKCRH
jgi:putative hydrolase of HD superfamily